ncbi:sensor histidine kinase [Calidithermus chliarophilus]|uniref:sensor histidine kinase n=1 Tax=Calidithermus chliarophilus TaxID=52023 RepID=UPI000409CC66|nr:ATP-binding protein [Calidithermus chliarophilus]
MFEAFLRKVPLFAELLEEDLARLCRMAEEVRLPAGQVLFVEGSLADRAYVLYEGELEIVKHLDGREVLIDVQHVPGTVIGEMALLEETTRLATVRASRDSVLLGLSHREVNELFNLNPGAAKIMLRTLMGRWRALETQVRLSEKMVQLGTFTAGIAHELNNPAAAVLRGAGQLQELLDAAIRAHAALERLGLSQQQQARVEALERQVRERVASPLALDPLSRSDREEELEAWLEGRGQGAAWKLAPGLAELGLEAAHLDELARAFSPQQFPLLVEWLATRHAVHGLLREIALGAGRISEIVGALRSYVYLDQAPLQNVDVHAGLENTLTLLRHKLQPGVVVRREYAPGLPPVPAYGGELNQVWTNLVDNALDALDGRGQLTLRTRQEGEVVVEVEDSGPGIPPEHLPRIFDPFFTTKPLGKGVGLGLSLSYNIVHKHKGHISVASEPGRTVFQVRLPTHG